MSLRANNPGNIKGEDKWVGLVGKDKRGHLQFDTLAHGCRALARTFQQKYRNGKTTLLAICESWADAGDTQGSIPGNPLNNPHDYALYVGQRVGLGVTQAIPQPEKNVWTLYNILMAMAAFECGEECPQGGMLQGIGLWLERWVEGKQA